MSTEEQALKTIKIFIDAINKARKEIDPKLEIQEKQMAGLLILEFPADHETTTEVRSTVMGHICFSHTLEFLAELKAEQLTKAMDYAS